MRLLVTRPQPAAERTARKLEALGHEVAVLPLMQAQHYPDALEASLDRRHDALAVTSAEAIRALATLGPALDPHLATPLFAVGEATARTAAALGFTDIRIGPGTGEALAARIPPETGTLVYLAGAPRALGFEQVLTERKVKHVTVESYRMVPIAYGPQILPDLLRGGSFDAVLLYSRQTARHFATLLAEGGLDAAAFSGRYLCLSAAVQDELPSGAIADVAAAPDEEHLFELLGNGERSLPPA
ncbi:uroporphyrinogen-III synthase [Sinorhizobium alkalisoli]|uniref:uroporphyrinogen-III synthase n=1 Tax=Sinorhizobium alkalisoli TaxID=1752398 RepID=UPI00124E819E|nr:uroporphyrinogen-III synthase [Sinorhizobium alkalisoli]QFI67903.1 Uroporphyrinogen-III synthase [Sinorhizobium alkalisoli]